MKKNKTNSPENILRSKAEEQLKRRKTGPLPAGAETIKLLHELQVHQIELEMMNEELKFARDKAETTAEKFEELYDFAPAGYLTLQADGTISELNLSAALMLGAERQQLINKNFRYFVTEDILHDFDVWFSKILNSESKVSFELPLKCTGNSSIFVYIEGKSIGNDGKCIISMINITKRKDAEEALSQISAALKRSNTELEQFAYAISHDLQEPLRMISIYTHILKEDLKGKLDNKTTEFMGFIIDGTKRMSLLIEGLLSFAHIGSKKMELSNTDLNEVKTNVLRDLNFAISESNAEIKSDKLPSIKANSTLMHQLFQNLIANALKFRGDKKPVINITVERNSNDLIFCVRDNGIGINPEYAERIFVIFKRLNDSEKYSGSGIGLALCKKIVDIHGGRIWVESEEGKGAAFYFTLPDKK